MTQDPRKRTRPTGLVRHLCKAMILDFRAVGPEEAARMLRENPDGEARASVVEKFTEVEWAGVLTRVADALRGQLRRAVEAEEVERVLNQEIDATGRKKAAPPSSRSSRRPSAR